ncbi:MAG: PorT family protein [Bacteroidetes bacterium]|jgi:hypothetical protein|nr:PorT family protein [Bacteroidota bacterium]
MKKSIFILLSLIISAKIALAQQGENDLKNFRFGLKAAPMITWYKPDDQKKFESGGAMFRFSYGLSTEFRLNKVSFLATGLQLDYDGGKLNMLDTNYYFLNKDSEIISKDDTTGQSYTLYQLKDRTYRTTYVTIPLTLKLRTNEIGLLTYYGQFGVNASFRMKNRVNDDVLASPNWAAASQTDIENTSDMQLFKFALNVGGGVEWGITGSTALIFGVNYLNGFSNVLKKESEYLFRTGTNDFSATKQNARSNGVVFTVGVLF